MIQRSPIKKHPVQRKEGFGNPEYREWLKAWPCWVCFEAWCEKQGEDARSLRADPEIRSLAYELGSFIGCGSTEAAHVGIRGLSQRCRDSEAMPLGEMHHRTGPDAQHKLGKQFWVKFSIERSDVFTELRQLYRNETGREA